MKQLSRKDTEAIAERVVQAYMKLPELQGQDIQCIDPVLLCEELLNLNIDFVRLSLDGSLLGLTRPKAAALQTGRNGRQTL